MYEWGFDNEHVVSYLPLSHIAAGSVDIYWSMNGGATVHFADKMALQGSLIKTLVEAKPTVLFGVSRVFEKIQDKLVDIGKKEHWPQEESGEFGKSIILKQLQHLVKAKSLLQRGGYPGPN